MSYPILSKEKESTALDSTPFSPILPKYVQFGIKIDVPGTLGGQYLKNYQMQIPVMQGLGDGGVQGLSKYKG